MKASYLKLFESGELKKRLEALEELLYSCTVCPRGCKVNRMEDKEGVCRAGYLPYITSICDHHGEEPVLSGRNGSGTVFFGSCNLRCVYCQNWQISQDRAYFKSFVTDFKEAAQAIVDLQNRYGVHNINFVSPSHFVPQMVRIIYEAVPLGLHVPIVYNSNGYDSLKTLRLLDGIVDIYLPDFKYFDDAIAMRYSQAKGYTIIAKEAVKEMYRQVGNLVVDKNGIAWRGLLIRHLILPNDLANTEKVLRWIAKELSPEAAISLMSQYYPTHRAESIPLLSRGITYSRYRKAADILEELGMTNGFRQEMSAPFFYQPDFHKDGHPFENH
ncbi:MAG TPA: radical SAM protein [Caldithrix abyssi]|uniref:Radical SAM protein n=1 Tax=Caldithrix abyssi TaxID=187145 RepID=A0A7V4UF26_CALAY|nr:radical SAM protein [Caldithrix abyssi]